MMIAADSEAKTTRPVQRPVVLNDIHSRLNATPARALLRPESLPELLSTIAIAVAERTPLSVAGGRHAMGGQQFLHHGMALDMRGLNQILRFNPDLGTITVEAGICWPELMAALEKLQSGEPCPWSIVQKQTGADTLSLGGAVSANIHGRGLKFRPFIQDIESLQIITADGLLDCSRTVYPELFKLAVGGYGLFGVIYSVTLRLQRRRRLRRIVTIHWIDELIPAFEERMNQGCTYGDFQFAIDPRSKQFLNEGVFSCYQEVDPSEPESNPEHHSLSPAQWERLLYLAHGEKTRGFQEYSSYYLSTNGQLYWSDSHQMSYYPQGYHSWLDMKLGSRCPGSEMISELYVPRTALSAFMRAVRDRARQENWNIIYGTVRLIEADQETFLAWARERWACVVFNLCVEHSEHGLDRARCQFRTLIALALRFGGSFYLTYHKWATAQQIEAAYPNFREFLEAKRFYDPDELFSSNWYRHYCRQFHGL